MSTYAVTMDDLKKQKTYQTENRFFKRGDIWMADLGVHGDTTQEGYRAVLIVSNDKANKYSPTLTVLPLSTSKAKINKNLIVHTLTNSTCKPSVVLGEQITTIDKDRLCKFTGSIDAKEMLKVEYSLLIQLGIIQIPSK